MACEVLRAKFRGCLLGLAVGDCFRATVEGFQPEWIERRYPTREALFHAREPDCLVYTDDTQMMIGITETWVAHRDVSESALCQAFVRNYVAERGYSTGARLVLEAMAQGRDYQHIAEEHFPGGSLGNGAAMRVAPIGLAFSYDLDRVAAMAEISALPTHRHPLAIDGARLLALAVALNVGAAMDETFDRQAFFEELIERAITPEFRRKLQQAAELENAQSLGALGSSVTALDSVVTAMACFALAPFSFWDVLCHAVFLGGDTDTVAAMACALAEAWLGDAAISPALLDRVEDDGKGRSHIASLADQLFQQEEHRHEGR